MKKKATKNRKGQWEITLKGSLDQEKVLQMLLSDSIQPYLKNHIMRLPEQTTPNLITPSLQLKYLSDHQSEDYRIHAYQCFDKIHIPGTILNRRSNQIIVNDNAVKLGNSLFILFLRLAVELKKKRGGWINRVNLAAEGVISDQDRFQSYSNLRTALVGSLLQKNGKKIVESDGAKNYRLSIHPDFLTFDRDKILKYPNCRVQKLARKLFSKK